MRLRDRPQQHMLEMAWPRNLGSGARAPARSPLVRLAAARGFPGTRLHAPRPHSPTSTAPHRTRHGDRPALPPSAQRQLVVAGSSTHRQPRVGLMVRGLLLGPTTSYPAS